MQMPKVETERLILRPMELDDAQSMYEYASDDDVLQNLTFPKHLSVEQSRNVIQNLFLPKKESVNVPESYAIIEKISGKMIGCCDFTNIDRFHNSEIGYVLNRKYWGKGYMTEAVTKVIQIGFEHLNLERIVIRHNVDNIRSKRVIVKLGLVFEGIERSSIVNGVGKRCDVAVYSIIKDEYLKRKEGK